METASPQRMTIIILGAALLAAVAVGAVVFFIPPFNPQSSEPEVSESTDEGFNTAILTQPEYKALDASLFTRGFLPVQPPATAGKQNPFQ